MAYSVPDSRSAATTAPNNSRAVRGTQIFDVQKIEARAQGAPINSDVGLPPTDSRVVDNIPQNSRTPGTFGPGV